MTFQITGTQRKKATRDLHTEDLTVEELTELLGTHLVGEKDGPAIIPAIFRPCPTPCRNAEKEGFVDCGGGELHRLKDNVAAMTMFGADLDDISPDAFQEIVTSLMGRGLMFWAWHTHSHVENSDKVRARLLIPFHKPLEIVSAKQWSAGAWPNLVKWLGMDKAARADNACKDPCRIYYLPRKPNEEDKHEASFFDGIPLDWERVLGDSLKGFSAPLALAPTAPIEDPSRPVDLEDFRERLKSVRKKETRALITNALKGEPLTPPPGARRDGDPSRYVAWRQLTGAMAAKAEDWESSTALLSVVRASHVAEANETPGDFTEWDTIEHLFETARAGIPQLRAEWEAQKEADARMFKRLMGEHSERIAEQISDSSGADPSDSPGPVSEEGSASEDFDWTEGLQMKHTQSGDQVVESCASNVEWVLRYHPAWKGVFRFNEFSREVEMHGGPIAPRQVITLKDSHAGLVADWLSRDRFLNQRVRDHVVWSRMILAAEGNPYDPLKDYLNGLKWDGKSRIEQGPFRYFGAPTKDDLDRDIAGHLSTTFRKWMIGAVARGLQPGCKVDTVLHLEGIQGVGKSSAVRVLGGEFFSEGVIDIHSKDSWAACSTNWIIELGELETFRRSEVTAQKRFFALCEDQYRPPYGRASIKAPRRCVFVGTTNTDDYLTDPTGNRRHWSVAVGQIDIPALQEDRDQLWAEAVALYRAGGKWYLNTEEAQIQTQQAELRTTDSDAVDEAILAWWLKQRTESRPTEITTHLVCTQALEEKAGRGYSVRIGHALRRLGFLRKRKEIAGQTMRFYTPTPELLNMRQTQAPSAVQLIAGSKQMTLVKPS